VDLQNYSGNLFIENNISLSSLHLSKTCEVILCRNNNLTELYLEEGNIAVDCSRNNLTKINLPNSINELCIDYGVLTDEQIQWCVNNNVHLCFVI
jgi:hypothetical protein